MKTIEEQIAVMQHYANGGEIEYYSSLADCWKIVTTLREFNWSDYDYRIKEQKKTVTIEKWLTRTSLNQHLIVEAEKEFFEASTFKQIKRLETYKIEL